MAAGQYSSLLTRSSAFGKSVVLLLPTSVLLSCSVSLRELEALVV